MKGIIKLLGLLFSLLGISFLIESEGIYRWVAANNGNTGFYLSVIIGRVGMGILLLFLHGFEYWSRMLT